MDYSTLIKDLRVCSGNRDCEGCSRNFTINNGVVVLANGCDLLESDAADAIEALLTQFESLKLQRL